MSRQGRVLKELLIALRFGIIGIAATALHIGVVWVLVGNTQLPALLANLIAFLCAFVLSFTGNYIWTFSAPGSPGKAMRRFFLISLSAFLANSTLLAAILASGWLSPRLAAVASASVVPGITFLASRLWGFRQQSHD
ncbi:MULTISPECIES: GtrA family protein [Pseudomonadaceae]|uniref:GtrA family protein n=1 Tax=Pseudomonas denitrificans TaxID=43306 RepID=A0A9X7R6K3_PSEDE|nr:MULTISPECIES: GtrA family protein [Pseudomonadaceae]MBD9634228.1 GtrA family protein [Pseudomonas sp. PDM19]QEY74618.1 GtrA family protein [Pseudomonas denitrificans (nom. rej.)]